jgi:predicted O-linked N-acetylglucosamine transferase (SPINDLY family)
MSKKSQTKKKTKTQAITPSISERAIAQAQQYNQQGIALAEETQWEAAIKCFEKAIDYHPQYAQAFNNLGIAWKNLAKLSKAINYYHQAIALKADYAEAYYNLGIALQEQQQLEPAAQAFQQAIALNSQLPQMHLNLGNIFQELGKHEQAQACYQQALALAPDYTDVHRNLAHLLRRQGDWDEAINLYRQALSLNPIDGKIYLDIGLTLQEQGKQIDALEWLQQAVAFKADPTAFAQAHYHLANALEQQNRLESAIQHYQEAIKHDAKMAEAYLGLGNALQKQGKLTQAKKNLQQAIQLKPNFISAQHTLSINWLLQGQINYAISQLKKVLNIAPYYHPAHSVILMAMNYSADITLNTLLAEHRKYNDQYIKPLANTSQPHHHDHQSTPRLKIGYVSPDFRQHSVAFFMTPILAHHDHQHFEIVCYYNQTYQDKITKQLKAHADQWIDCASLSDQALAERIRQDKIDILVDLAGHTADNRLLTFARKPAPIQVTYLGYPTTTGLTTIDYRITDHYIDIQGLNDAVSETPIKLPNSYFCYNPLPDSPPINNLPALTQPKITFGSFNNYAKITPQVKALWAKILQQIPHAQLLLKNKSLNDKETLQQLLAQFTQLGIQSQRINIIHYATSQQEHLATYHQIDIALDTFPYNGATTTCEALWMGVPVVTLIGQKHASRMGLSILSTVGLKQLIASTPTEYLAINMKLTDDLNQLQQLRQNLRQQMQNSPLMNGAKFTRDLEAAYRNMIQPIHHSG